MPQPNDLSRSLVALDQNSTIIAVVELSQSSWFVPGPNFWIGKADELLSSRRAEPPLDSSFKKNLHPKPSVVGEATDGGHESLNSRNDDEPLTEGGAARGYEEDLERPVSPASEPLPHPQDSTEAVTDKSSLTSDRVEPPKLQDGGALVCRALGGRCRHKTCGQRRHCLAKRGRKAWETRIRHQIWDAKGERRNHQSRGSAYACWGENASAQWQNGC
jgi:hypothetical protein